MRSSSYLGGKWRTWVRVLMGFMPAFFACVLGSYTASGEHPARVTQANYQLARRFGANDMRAKVQDRTVRPVWIDGGERFWYALRAGTVVKFFMVDVAERSKREIAVDLKPVGPGLVELTIAGRLYRFDTVSQEVTEIDPTLPPYAAWETPSPDGTLIAYAKNHNIFIKRQVDGGGQRQITRDGEPFYSFAEPSDPYFTGETARGADSLRSAQVFWSPDSKKLVASRHDVRHYRDLWVIDSVDSACPVLTTYKQRSAGGDLPKAEVWIYDLTADSLFEVGADKWMRSSYHDVVWSRDSRRLYMVRKSPDQLECELLIIDAATGHIEVLLNESIGALALTKPVVELWGEDGFLWWSRRDGYGHYYLYDAKGKLSRQVTAGRFNVARNLGVARQDRVLFLMANGAERRQNPYYEHLYRVNLSGTGLRRLTYEDAHHEVYLSPSYRCFVDNYSRVDKPGGAVLLDTEGNLLMELETVDISRLVDEGWKAPETFKARAADGKTDIWGVMWKPYDFDPDRLYPIVAFVYPGPQDELVPLAFVDALDNNAHLAQFGFIVCQFGTRGGSYKRSLEYSEYYRGNLRDYPVNDYKAVIEELAKRHDYIDIDRVGIWGGSSGAYAAVTSILTYPDFYKVCVARSGPHDPGIYHAWWNDQFQGMTKTTLEDGTVRWLTEEAKGNLQLARNLKGRLLIVHSEMDNNVHPAHSARMAKALMAAGKRFDYFVVPGAGHGWGPNWPYVQRMIWTYFVHHLMGDTRWDIDMFEDF